MRFDRTKFYEGYRTEFGALTQPQVDALNDLLGFIEADTVWTDIRHIAYALATAGHETAWTYRPIYEIGLKSYFNKYDIRFNPEKAKEVGNTQPGDGFRYRGAGFVQLTGRSNFRKFGLEDDPENALDPEVAFHVLTVGMFAGSFTGKKLTDYVNNGKTDYFNARKVINGTDKAAKIAEYAIDFEKILTAAKNKSAFANLAEDEIELDIPVLTAAPLERPTSGNVGVAAQTEEMKASEQSATQSPSIPSEPVAMVSTPQSVVEVAQIAPTPAEPPPEKEDALTRIGNKAAALWAGLGTMVTGAIATFASAPVMIVVAIVAAGALAGITYMVVNAVRQNIKDKRDYAAKIESDKREAELKIQREAQAFQLQLYVLKAAADPNLQAVTIAAPPPIELANTDSQVNS